MGEPAQKLDQPQEQLQENAAPVSAEAHAAENEQADGGESPLYLAGVGLACIALGIYQYFDLRAMEAEGGTREVHALIAMAYDMLGVWGVAGLLCGSGVAFIIGAVRKKMAPN